MRSIAVGLALAAWCSVVRAEQQIANTPWSLWTAKISLPPNTEARTTQRGEDAGYGVDLRLGAGFVKAIIWDDDGDGFFEIRAGNNASCKIDVGSDGPDPGLQLTVFAQHGMRCKISGSGGPKAFQVKISGELTSDKSAECRERSDTEEPCSPPWRPAATKLSAPPSWALWTAMISLPRGSVIKHTRRGDDHGWGVDIVFHGKGDNATVEGRVWDDDGDGFFEVILGTSSCKIDVGSNGLGPGLQVSVFMQKGMECTIDGSGGPKKFDLVLHAAIAKDGSADCAEKQETEEPCHPAWTPKHLTVGNSSPLWRATMLLPPGDVRVAKRDGEAGYGVDLDLINGSMVVASVWDDHGSGFFEFRSGSASCKVAVGSKCVSPGLQVSVLAQSGMKCEITRSGDPPLLGLTTRLLPDGTADCEATALAPTSCGETWRSKSALSAPPSWAIWTAEIHLPAGAVARKTHRVQDPGYGVDLRMRGGIVDASVWDDDGDAFFELVLGANASCKIDVGSNGLDPKLTVSVFAQKGANCKVQGSGGPKAFSLVIDATLKSDGSADCKEREDTEEPCHPAWCPSTVAVKQFFV